MSNYNKLCYLWISNSFFKGTEYNFNANEKFSVTFDGNGFDRVAHLKKESFKHLKQVDNFYGENIYNITGIVGKNGSGKTSFINFFNNNIANLTTMNGEGCISVWDVNGEYKIISNLHTIMFNNNKHEKSYFNCNYPEIILLSNVFDARVSSNAKYKEKKQRNDRLLSVTDYTLNTFMKEAMEENKNYPDVIENEIINECLNYLKDDGFKELLKSDINCMPNSLSLSSKPYIFDKNEMILKTNFNKDKSIINSGGINFKRFKKLCVKQDAKYLDIDEDRYSYEKTINDIGINLWAYLCHDLRINNLSTKELDIYLDDLKNNESESSNALTILGNLLDKYQSCLPLISKIKELIIFLIEVFPFEKLVVKGNSKLIIKFDKYRTSLEFLDRFRDVKESIDFIQSNSKYKFLELNLEYVIYGEDKIRYSSGELMKFRLYVNLYDAIQNLSNNSGIIIVDEWDLYLHPSLQREAIYDFVQFIDKVAKNKKIHLIFTSNTPFIISDLPLSNIIFVENMRTIEKTTKTFGQNIHTILRDDFFMEKSTIGKFSEQKIRSVYDFLICDKEDENLKKESEYLIDILGEELIKNKLLNLYNKKYKGEYDGQD